MQHTCNDCASQNVISRGCVTGTVGAVRAVLFEARRTNLLGFIIHLLHSLSQSALWLLCPSALQCTTTPTPQHLSGHDPLHASTQPKRTILSHGRRGHKKNPVVHHGSDGRRSASAVLRHQDRWSENDTDVEPDNVAAVENNTQRRWSIEPVDVSSS